VLDRIRARSDDLEPVPDAVNAKIGV